MTITPEQLAREKEYAKVLEEQNKSKEKAKKLDDESAKDKANSLKTIADLEAKIREIKLDSEIAVTLSDQVNMNEQLFELSQLIFKLQQRSSVHCPTVTKKRSNCKKAN